MNKTLIVIDAQEDFVRGPLGTPEAIKALPVIKEAVGYAYENFSRKTIYTKDTHGLNYLQTEEGKALPVEHCILNTPGWRICTEVLIEESQIIEKHTFGCTEWNNIARSDEIIICGFCTDICVMANVQIIKAYYPDLQITVIEDGCAGTSTELHEAAVKVLRSCQIEVLPWKEIKERLKSFEV